MFFSVYFSSFDDYSYYTYCWMHFCMLANFFLENNKLITNPIGIGIVSSLLDAKVMLVKKWKSQRFISPYQINFLHLSDNRWYSRNSGQHYLHHCVGQWRNEEFLQPSSLLPCHHWHPLHHHCSHWLFLRKRQVWSIRGKIYGLLHIQWNSMIFYDLLLSMTKNKSMHDPIDSK